MLPPTQRVRPRCDPRPYSVTEHRADLVGSTLADPYLSYSAALFALAGPLHG